MRALQLVVVVSAALLVLENGPLVMVVATPRSAHSYYRVYKTVPSASYSYSTRHRSSSSRSNAVAPSSPQGTPQAVQRRKVQLGTTQARADATYRRAGDIQAGEYMQYHPVENTPEVRKAREEFFRLYNKQAKLVAKPADTKQYDTLSYTQSSLIGRREDDDDDDEQQQSYDLYGYSEEEEDHEHESGYSEGEGYYEDHESGFEEENSEEIDEYEQDSNEGDDSSSSEESSEENEWGEESSEEDEWGEESSEEDEWGEESSEEDGGEESSEEDEGGEESSEENGEASEEGDEGGADSSEEEEEGNSRNLVWGPRGWAYKSKPSARSSLNTNFLVPQPVTETPAVRLAKRKFFDLYKVQAEMSFNAPDH
ncbi:RNA polymerase II-associated factor 1 homolog isoform X1 [Cherax quadricarinatus]|uniref:RNA polymerase II-associated factor 1 homolog isoform X1 n=2 Tax=Cherax quadricarinatus TaxID=27406 RepID=UPI00387E9B79